MKKLIPLILITIIFPSISYSQVNKTSDVYKLTDGNYLRVGKVVRDNDWKFTTYIYKNINGSDILIGKAVDGKVFAINKNGNYYEVFTGERDNKRSTIYFIKNGSLIGKGSWWSEFIYKATGYNIWDGTTYELAGKIDGGGENKSLGAALLLIYN
jgi:hypothetical protein